MKVRFLIAILIGMFLVAGSADAKKQVIRDKRDKAPPSLSNFPRSSSHITKAVLVQSGRMLRFTVKLSRRSSLGESLNPSVSIRTGKGKFQGTSFSGLIKIIGRRYVEIDGAEFTMKPRSFTYRIPLRAIGNPRAFRWMAYIHYHDSSDEIPNWPRLARFKVSKGPPAKSKGPALRGPRDVKQGKPVTFQAYWFTPGTQLSVAVKRKSGKGKKRIEGSFTAKAKGKTAIKFKFPNVKWTGKTKVNVCGTPPRISEQQCAGRTVKIAKPPPLPRRVIKFTGGKGTFVIDCLKSRTCKGRLTISDGKTKLVKPRRYTVRAGGEKKIRLRLTKAGRKVLGKDGRAKGLGILKAPDGAKVKFTAILKQKRG